MNKFSMALLLSITSSFMPISDAIALSNEGTMTLNLTGVIDMTIDASEVQYIPGTLSGTTRLRATPVYTDQPNEHWVNEYALIALSSSYNNCNGRAIDDIPNHQGKYGVKLSHDTSTKASVYVTPALNYSILLSDFSSPSFQNSYSGQFFSYNQDGLIDRYSTYICLSPRSGSAEVPTGGTKDVIITSPGSFPVYISPGLIPGRLTYKGIPFYVVSFASMTHINSAAVYAQVDILADIMVKRSCSVTGVSAQQFNENMTLTDEITRNSTFTVSCGGIGNPVNISATIKEGSHESGQPTKLLLAPINGTVSDEKPWVLGMPYRQGQEPSLTCNDAGRSGLIKFDNTEVELPGVNMGNDVAENVGIKWALCKTPQVKAGDYRAKVDISIFVRG